MRARERTRDASACTPSCTVRTPTVRTRVTSDNIYTTDCSWSSQRQLGYGAVQSGVRAVQLGVHTEQFVVVDQEEWGKQLYLDRHICMRAYSCKLTARTPNVRPVPSDNILARSAKVAERAIYSSMLHMFDHHHGSWGTAPYVGGTGRTAGRTCGRVRRGGRPTVLCSVRRPGGR